METKVSDSANHHGHKTFVATNMHSRPGCHTGINLSKFLKRALTVEKLTHSESRTRQQKVSALREKIQKGVYTIDYDKLSEALLQAFRDDEIAFRLTCRASAVANAVCLS